jgi:hypothetical protein
MDFATIHMINSWAESIALGRRANLQNSQLERINSGRAAANEKGVPVGRPCTLDRHVDQSRGEFNLFCYKSAPRQSLGARGCGMAVAANRILWRPLSQARTAPVA